MLQRLSARWRKILDTSTEVTSLIASGSISAASVTSGSFKLSGLNTAPATASATGVKGDIRITADSLYVCTATDTWVKVALATWV